jgi:hypothetical protein
VRFDKFELFFGALSFFFFLKKIFFSFFFEVLMFFALKFSLF